MYIPKCTHEASYCVYNVLQLMGDDNDFITLKNNVNTVKHDTRGVIQSVLNHTLKTSL